jgi:signal transduction histidine kinase
VAARGGEVRFGVADTGIGIPPGAEATIFEPFVQLDAGLSRRYGGTGLGLYIASRLARLLGGRVELASTLGRGSRFELVLPRGD